MADQVNAGGEGTDGVPAGPGDGTPRKTSWKAAGCIVVAALVALVVLVLILAAHRALDSLGARSMGEERRAACRIR